MKSILPYIIRNFSIVYNYKIEFPDIDWGEEKEAKIKIRRKDNGYFERKEALSVENVAWKEWNGVRIPFIFDTQSEEEVITLTSTGVVINFDIISASFFFLSGWQEYISGSKDRYGRFEYSGSVQKMLGITGLPVVNYYFDILRSAVDIAFKCKIQPANWNDKDVTVCITHDIDNCESAWKQGSYRELLKGNYFAPFKLIYKKIFSNDEWFNIDKIIRIEQSYGITSTFLFLPESLPQDGIPNADYNISGRKYRSIIAKLTSLNFEVGIHGSTGTHKDLKKFKADISKIGQRVKGNRFHFLLYDVCLTPSVLANSGIKYDSTLGFAEAPGFRNSFCHPFFLFDISSGEMTEVIEIPLTVMDVTFEKGYLNSGREEALQMMKNIFFEIKKFNGCFTLLWHNTFFSDYKFSGWRDVYESFIGFAMANGALITNGNVIYDLVDQKSKGKGASYTI